VVLDVEFGHQIALTVVDYGNSDTSRSYEFRRTLGAIDHIPIIMGVRIGTAACNWSQHTKTETKKI
jgi:hypothetical protein